MTTKIYTQTLEGRKYVKTFNFIGRDMGDFIGLIGIEGTMNLIKFFGGSFVYIPGRKSIRRQIITACILSECERLAREGKDRGKIIAELMETFRGHWRTKKVWENKLAAWFGEGNGKTVLQRAKLGSLLDQAAIHRKSFKDYGLI
jgi:hypothetical protein